MHHIERALIVVGLALLFFYFNDIAGDGAVRYEGLVTLLEQRTVPTIPYSMIGPVFAAPVFWLGYLYQSPDWWISRFNNLVLITGLIATYWLTRGESDRTTIRRFFLVLIAASMFPSHVRGFYGEVFTAVCVGVGLLAVHYGRPLAGWTLAIVGTANTPAAIAGLTCAAIAHAWQTKRLRQLSPILIAAALILFESWVRRGDPFVTGYEGNRGAETVLPYSGRPGFSYPFFFGLLSILFSFGKGLMFFAPGLLLWTAQTAEGVASRLRAANWLWLAFLAGLILIYASWWSWYGGWAWGPRFFLFASIPASLAIAARLGQADRASLGSLIAAALVLTLSVWVGITGAAFGNRALGICEANHYALEALCWYVPEFSTLWRPFVEYTAPIPSQMAFIAYALGVYAVLMIPIATALVERSRASVASGAWSRAITGWKL